MQCIIAVEEASESAEVLIPHLSPPQVIYILTRQIVSKKPQNVSKVVGMLSKEQVDDVLNLVTQHYRDPSYLSDEEALLLAQRASKSAVDASLLHVSRHRNVSKALVKSLSEHATEEGKRVAEQLANRMRE